MNILKGRFLPGFSKKNNGKIRAKGGRGTIVKSAFLARKLAFLLAPRRWRVRDTLGREDKTTTTD